MYRDGNSSDIRSLPISFHTAPLDDPPPHPLKRWWPSVNTRSLKRSPEAFVICRRFKEEEKVNNKGKFRLFETHFRPLYLFLW